MRMRILSTVFLFCLSIAFSLHAQSPVGYYTGALTRDGSVQLMELDLQLQEDALVGRYSIPELGIFDVRCDTVAFEDDSLRFTFYYGDFACLYHEEQQAFTGASIRWSPKIRIHLKRTAPVPLPYTPTDISFRNGEVTLKGTLFEPVGAMRYPVAVLIHGSGDQHRETPYYRSLAHSLAQRGIASFLYDKRGSGASGGDADLADMELLADDAVAACMAAREVAGERAVKIGFLGSSQGGWIAPLAAAKVDDCGFVILNVGPAVSVFEQDIHRLRYGMPDYGYEAATVDSAVAFTELYFRYVRSGKMKDREQVEREGMKIRDREWAEHVNAVVDEGDVLWWRRNDFDPAKSLSTLRCPTLALFGENDLLVPPAENEARMQALLARSGVEHKVVTIPDMGHDGRASQGLNGANWDWPNVFWRWRRQPPEFIEQIVRWIQE